MGSDQFRLLEDIGIERGGGEVLKGPPEAFTVIGLDITADKLTALYPATSGRDGAAHERARAIIRGVRDRTRTTTEPPPEFVASLGSGVQQRVIVANLGPDKHGKAHVVVCVGRQRTWGLRLWNKRAKPEDRLRLPAEIRAFPNKATIDAELTALEMNASSNVFVAMRASQLADHATMLHEKGIADGNIAIKIGAKDADHVALLLMLAQCAPEVQAAVDADRVALAKVKVLHKLPADEQARRVTRSQAGENRAAQNAAAPPRAKTRPARELAGLADAFRDGGHIAMPAKDVVLDVLTFAAGGEPAPWLAPIVEKMREAAATEK